MEIIAIINKLFGFFNCLKEKRSALTVRNPQEIPEGYICTDPLAEGNKCIYGTDRWTSETINLVLVEILHVPCII